MIDLPRAFLKVAGTARDQQQLRGFSASGAETGVVQMVIVERSAAGIDTEMRQRLDSVWKEMESGALWSPVSRTARDR